MGTLLSALPHVREDFFFPPHWLVRFLAMLFYFCVCFRIADPFSPNFRPPVHGLPCPACFLSFSFFFFLVSRFKDMRSFPKTFRDKRWANALCLWEFIPWQGGWLNKIIGGVGDVSVPVSFSTTLKKFFFCPSLGSKSWWCFYSSSTMPRGLAFCCQFRGTCCVQDLCEY